MILKNKVVARAALLAILACGAYWVLGAQSVRDDEVLSQDKDLKPSKTSSILSKDRDAENTFQHDIKKVRDGLSPSKGSSNVRARKEDQYDTRSVEEDFTVAFKAFPHLKSNYVYSSKAILSGSEARKWDEILSNPKNITNTLEGIKGHYNPDYDLQFSTVNQERIRFIKYASQLNNNPSSSILFEGIEEALLWFPDNMATFPDDQKKSLVGDKAELIYIYEAFRPNGAIRLNEMAELNLKFARVLKYARTNASHLNRLL